MDRLKKTALLTALAENLRKKGSWCGETHLQKATYFLQELERVPVGFDFILYKHGPFSFELRDTLTGMRADGLFDLHQQWPYGPTLIPTEKSKLLRQQYSKTLQKYKKQLNFVSDQLGRQNVSELEKLATALYIRIEMTSKSETQRAKYLHSLKPHVSLDDSLEAVKTVDGFVKLAKSASS
ncbi:MAG TPA: hypothetical protein VGT24_08800 [Candidatus Acidoferrales bacterium]|nr:hypothetical protein [Candidatus Acidoferrales bacterium]